MLHPDSIPLAKAERYAGAIVEWLRPFCSRIEIAGSIRRRRPFVGDVDVVCIPHLVEKQDLLGGTGVVRNLVREELIAYMAKTPAAVWKSGKEPQWDGQNFLLRLPKCELDVWCANEENFGSRFLCRTGSREHNVWLAERAKAHGGHWEPYRGLFMGSDRFSVSEVCIYEALGFPFVEPGDREVDFLRKLPLAAGASCADGGTVTLHPGGVA
jgi:DNA polymerase (family 10)